MWIRHEKENTAGSFRKEQQICRADSGQRPRYKCDHGCTKGLSSRAAAAAIHQVSLSDDRRCPRFLQNHSKNNSLNNLIDI